MDERLVPLLEDWKVVRRPGESFDCVSGTIWKDRRPEFPNGTKIFTSAIQCLSREYDSLRTQNTFYFLGNERKR